MKKTAQLLTIFALILTLALSPWLGADGKARAAAPAQGDTARPLLYIVDYHTDYSGKMVSPWVSFGLTFTLGNNGHEHARNIVMTFSSDVFDSLDGGVFTVWEVEKENEGTETHTVHFKVNDMSTWMYSGVIRATTTYTDPAGNAFSDTFSFALTIDQPAAGGTTPTQTPTPIAINRPQMVVSGYNTDVDPLQPGSAFVLTLRVGNVGNADARAVSLVYGGGASVPGDSQGTPTAGGVSGTSGDLTNFAPLGKSNVVLLGNVPVAGTQDTTQQFIVNVTTQPGAYPLKLSFVYTDPKGNRLVDDQVITLLVYSLPQLEISFYRTPDLVNAGNMTSLPIQITNLARKSVVLGNVTVTSDTGDLTNNTILVGTLDPGGYFTFDPMYMPFSEGQAQLNFVINYTDDFNQLRTYTASLPITVEPAMVFPTGEPVLGPDGMPLLDENGNPIYSDGGGAVVEPVQETSFWAKIWNAIKGFFGFGTKNQQEEIPTPTPEEYIPLVPGGKG